MTRQTGRRRGGTKLIAVVVGALVLGAGAGYAFFGRNGEDAGGDRHAQKDGGKQAEPEEPVDPPTYIDAGSYLVNLSSAGGLRYLKVSVIIGVRGLEPPEAKGHGGHGGGGDAEVTLPPSDDPPVRDAIVRVLAAQSFEDLKQKGPGDELRQTLLEAISEAAQECEVESVLITSFVMQ